MASSWGTSWGTAWGESWSGVTVTPPVTPDVAGGGGGGGYYLWPGTRGKKRRNRTHELFAAVEDTIRAEVFGEPVPVLAAAAPVAAAPPPAIQDDLDRLARYAREDEVLQARLARLQADLAAFAAAQREAALRDDEERWMLLS